MNLSCSLENNTLSCEWGNCEFSKRNRLVVAGEPNYVRLLDVDREKGKATFIVPQIEKIYVYLECKNGKIAKVVE